MRAAANSVGRVIYRIYNRSILPDVMSGFHELTPGLVSIGKGVSPTVTIDHTRPG